MDNDTGSRSLLQSVLGFFTWKQPPILAKPALVRSQKREDWLRTAAFLPHDDPSEADPESVRRTLCECEHLVQDDSDSDREMDFEQSFQQPEHEQYPTLCRMIENPNRDPHAPVTRSGKRKPEYDDVIQELSHLEHKRKKHRVLPREEPREKPREKPTDGPNLEDRDAKFALLMRRYLVSLDNALRRHWVCVCQKCSGLSVRLSLPQHKKDLEAEASFEVFFGVRAVPATALQEAKITVKDLRNSTLRRSSEHVISSPPEIAHICQSITESVGERNCLHFALEDGVFQRLRPQPKSFGSDRISRTVSLSALFNRQQELLGGAPILSRKGKEVLAVTLASALLPFLETPWLQFSFNHSMIQFFEPRQDGELPDITKPFLTLEHVPATSARSTHTGDSSGASKHMVHHNASVLALGILLCELHFCTPVQLMAKNPQVARNVNDDFYTCCDLLPTLEADTDAEYYLATKACLLEEYYPNGQYTDFEDVNVQRLFYQNVVKRLEAVIFNTYGIRIENLGLFDSRQNESYWGPSGREFVRLHTSKVEVSNENNTARASPYRPISDTTAVSYAPLHSNLVLRMSAQPSSGSQAHGHLAERSEKRLYFFDASHQTRPEEENSLSESWMENLLSSIHPYIDLDFDLDFDLAGPVRVAILDSGLDPENPSLIEDQKLDNPRIKEARSFVHGTESHDIRDEIGHGTHALGLLLKVAPCAEIYVARIARRETLDPNTYDDIAKASLSLYQSCLFGLS
ncbi:hypothetical protein A1O3_01629 [Capronia epimyces CBS 606.96]|uniref:DUF7580 domain-containing protein n=1 Tax=Capronia epimyces CBS 606.96 TaxID=1182542 RepID=W9YKI9_9EURO|nr:uncharacterized protein A1O3_01629 [Capronia epimyces CBS 606.96]EXJ93073.1 hypothetical protein A1O3_01629 [Capronia epimyces CBS 606.96]